MCRMIVIVQMDSILILFTHTCILLICYLNLHCYLE